MTAVSFVMARCLPNSATLQVLTLAFQGENELMAQVNVLHIAATGSVIAVITITYLLWQSIEQRCFECESVIIIALDLFFIAPFFK